MKRFARLLGSAFCAVPAMSLAGCGGTATTAVELRVASARPSGPASAAQADWRRVATPADRARLRGWRQAWADAMARLGGGADAATVAADPHLFDRDRALAGATPPAGAYRCRVFKLGANGTAMRNVTAYPAVACTVDDEGEVSSLYKVAGAQRPVGLLFPDSPFRAVFLGTMVFGDETRPLDYGQDGNRDLAGYIERIGDRRWRLVLPRPRFESLLDVIEIVPAR